MCQGAATTSAMTSASAPATRLWCPTRRAAVADRSAGGISARRYAWWSRMTGTQTSPKPPTVRSVRPSVRPPRTVQNADAAPPPRARRLGHDAEVPAVAEQDGQHPRQPQGRRRRLLHLDQQVAVESRQDRRDEAQPRPAPEPAVEVDQDDDEDPRHVTGQDGRERVPVGTLPQAERRQPGVQRGLIRHRPERPRLQRRRQVGPRASWSRTKPSRTASPRSPHQGPGGVGRLGQDLQGRGQAVCEAQAEAVHRYDRLGVWGANSAVGPFYCPGDEKVSLDRSTTNWSGGSTPPASSPRPT